MKKGRKAGLVNREARGTGDTDADEDGTRDQMMRRATSSGAGGNREFKQADEDNINDEVVRGIHMRRHNFGRALSRVTEEDRKSRDNSAAHVTEEDRKSSITGLGSRDVEIGGGGGDIFLSSKILRKEGVGKRESAAKVGDGGNDNAVPWSPSCGDRAEGSAGDIGRHPDLSSGGMEERDDSSRSEEGARSVGRWEGAREPSVAASRTEGSSVMVGQEGDCGNSSGGDSCATLHSGSDDEGNRERSSSTSNRQEAIRHIDGDSSDESRRVLENVKTDSDSSDEGGTYGGIGLVDTRREASLGRDHRPKGNRMKSNVRRTDESGGSSGGVENIQVATSPRRPPSGRLKGPRIDAIAHSSDDQIKVDDAIAGSGGGHPSRSRRRTSSTLPSGSSLSLPLPSTRHHLGGSENRSTRPGVNTHSHLKAKKMRIGWSRTRLSAGGTASDAVERSPLEDVSTPF